MTRPSAFDGPGILAQRVRNVTAAELRPVDARGVDLASVAVQDLQALAGDGMRILARGGQDVRLDDSGRDRPGGIEDQVGDLGTKERRAPIGLAHLHPRVPRDLLALDEVERVAGNVHDDEPVGQVMQQHPTAIQVDAQLGNTLRDRHVQFGDRPLADHPVSLEPVTLLIAA